MKPIYALDKLFTHKLFLNKYFLYAVSAISALVNMQHVMYEEFEYVGLFIFVVLVAKGFSKNWAIVLMVGLALSQLFNLGVNTYEGFTSTSRHPRVEKIVGLKQRIALKKQQQKIHEQRIKEYDAKIKKNNETIQKDQQTLAELEQAEFNIKDPVAKARAINSTEQQKKKQKLQANIKKLTAENEQLATKKKNEETQKTNTDADIQKLTKDLKKAEADLAAHNARKKAKADAKKYAKAKANAKAKIDAKAKVDAERNKLLGKKTAAPPGPGPAKATAKFSLMQEDDSDDSDEDEMEPKQQSMRKNDIDFLDPAKISGLTQETTKLMTTQKDLFTFMNSITPFVENAKKMLKDVDITKLTAGSK